ncbi:hypothetical protein Poli38472_001291 [Pythium oligandrum]|uniref:Uncharacterized protein n=1 Tax=Pythium oligandrum TaxID=41045 RepID=A0A8K1FMA0_PYTOL|nr:hypothetical protein Poli38472_001291 [Pythium oligandrum]|eukprot:TMW69135.1 hypothetical protein Poli38472_001291 [Pythium oligandrum]
MAMSPSPSASCFSSLDERIAHLQWRKTCNERQIQNTLRSTKQMQERDEFLKAAKNDRHEKKEWRVSVIQDELQKPLPVTTHFFHEMKELEQQLERSRDHTNQRHMTQIKQIQTKLDEREAQLIRKKEFELKKKQLLG